MNKNRQQSRNRFKTFALLFVGALVCGGVSLSAAWALMQQDIADTRQRYGSLVSFCNPIQPGNADINNLPEGGGLPIRAVVFSEGQQYVGSLHDHLRAEWRASNADETDIVICTRQVQEVIEHCSYGSEDDTDPTAFIKRIQHSLEIVLINAVTGGRIAETTVAGEAPERCPDQIFASNGTSRELIGPQVSSAEFENAVRPYLNNEE